MNLLIPLDIGLSMGLTFAWAVIALALAFRLFNFPDLTVEGSLPLGAAVFAVLVKNGTYFPLAMVFAFLAGAVAGGLTAFIHIRFKLNKFLCGIIVIAISYSLSLRIMGASNIGLLQKTTLFDVVKPLDNLTGPTSHPGTILLLASLIVIGSLLILLGLGSRQGMLLRTAGSNPEYARSLGIRVPLYLITGLFLTNGLSALSGVLLAMQQGFTDVSMGQGVLILALAAMTIGERVPLERVLPYHIFVVFAAILGSIIYQVIVAYAVSMGLAPTDLKLATAVLVLVIVAFRISRNGELFVESF